MIKIDQKAVSRKEFITVEFFYMSTRNLFQLELYSDTSGFNRKIFEQNLHRPGLALAGFVDLFSFSRVQVFGNTETQYLSQLNKEQRIKAIERIFQFNIPCIILTDNNKPFPELLELSNKYKIPLFGTPFSTTKLMFFKAQKYLDSSFVEVNAEPIALKTEPNPYWPSLYFLLIFPPFNILSAKPNK